MRRGLGLLVVIALLWAGAAPVAARPSWKRRIDRLAAGHSIGIAVAQDGRMVYRWASKARRVPASNQKLLTSMALLDTLGPDLRIATTAASATVRAGVVPGALWVRGHGDPAVASPGRFARSLPFPPTKVRRLARAIKAAGVRHIRGRVMGSRAYFRHDWNAPGWKPYFRSLYVALPSALTFNGNVHKARHTAQPERLLASKLTRRLLEIGVRVDGRPGSGQAPAGLRPVARVRSRALSTLIRYMDRKSSNFFAEVLGKRLAVATSGAPGTIAGGARAIAAWTARHGVRAVAHDASGLSYRNRISARGLVRLLLRSQHEPWGRMLKESLPGPGQGTLEDRLAGVPVRAKTGTLTGVSALSGWVWRRRPGRWATFSIMSRGLPKYRASAIEDRVVRILAASGRRPGSMRLLGYVPRLLV
ncbi:hypothetical protein BH24ACT26_BH24ACT26_03870 [soil metagenome]